MRQMVGPGLGDAPTVADLLPQRLAGPGRAASAEVDRCEPRRWRPTTRRPNALRRGARRVRRRGRRRPRGDLGRLHGAGLGCPTSGRSTASWPLSGGEQKRLVLEFLLAGPTRCCSSTSRTTSSTCPARSGSRAHRRVGQDHPVHQPRPRAARQHRDRVVTVDPAPPETWVDAPGRLGVVPRGAQRPLPPLRGACAAAGTRSTPRSRRWCCGSRSRRVQRRHGLQYKAAQTRLRKFEEEGRPTEQPREQQVRCGSRAAAPASARSSARTSS